VTAVSDGDAAAIRAAREMRELVTPSGTCGQISFSLLAPDGEQCFARTEWTRVSACRHEHFGVNEYCGSCRADAEEIEASAEVTVACRQCMELPGPEAHVCEISYAGPWEPAAGA
jgi:hypothetical protein